MDILAITADPIDVAGISDFVEDPGAGAKIVFVGVVRDHHDGRAVRELAYEAYVPMAEMMLEGIAEQMRGQWPLFRIALVHRVGLLRIGEVAVMVAVSSSHRDEAFRACRYGIDQIKAHLPIWKREGYADGTWAWQDAPC